MTPYRPRPIRFVELWQVGNWRIKTYGIAAGRPSPRSELMAAAKAAAGDRLNAADNQARHYGVGFLGVHDGRTSNFVFIDWWADENELHHHVYVSPTDDPAKLRYTTPSGVIACVWDLRLMAFERQAWLDAVLNNPRGPSVDEYLRIQLNEDV